VWEAFDPDELAALAGAQRPEEPWLPDALRRCTRALRESRAYVRFVPEEAWAFERNVRLVHPREGTLVLDVLTGRRVGGVEWLRYV
jgi:hypothetical protein